MIKKNTCCNIEKHRPDYSGRSMKWLMAVLVRRNTLNVTAQTQTAISVFKEWSKYPEPQCWWWTDFAKLGGWSWRLSHTSILPNTSLWWHLIDSPVLCVIWWLDVEFWLSLQSFFGKAASLKVIVLLSGLIISVMWAVSDHCLDPLIHTAKWWWTNSGFHLFFFF